MKEKMDQKEIVENLKKLQEEHEKQLSDIRVKLHTIETLPKAKALEGKCFKYKNGHAFGGFKKGWVYKHVVASAGDRILVDSFETDGPNAVDFIFNRVEGVNYFQHASFVPITLREYNRQFDKMIKTLVKFNRRMEK